MQFNVILEKDEYGYFAYVPNLKGCVTQGDTLEEAMQNIKEAIEIYIETLHQDEIASLAKRNYIIAPMEIDTVNA